jgi:transcription termination/antitermination protein NusG
MARGDASSTWHGPFKQGDRVRVVAGPFEDFEATVNEINQPLQMVRVTVTIFGRPTPIEIEASCLELL